jgi:gliding motility-associated-like protein
MIRLYDRFIHKIAVCIIAFCLIQCSSFSSAQTTIFAQLTGSPTVNMVGWSLNGNAQVGDTPGDADAFNNEIILTNTTTTQSGGVFYNSPINPVTCPHWTVEFDYRIWGGNAADGLAFCFINVPPSGFVNGGGVGIPGTANGLKVVIDTYNNCGGPNPELQIYNGVGYDECISGIVKVDNSAGTLNFVRSDQYQPAKITYDSGLINFYINNTLYLSTTSVINFAGYIGFTASTGAQYDQQSVRNVVMYSQQAPSNAGPNVVTCSGEPIQIGTTPNPAYTYSWSPALGLSNTTIANPTTTLTNTGNNPILQNYTVTTTLTANAGICPTTDQVLVTVYPQKATATSVSTCDPNGVLFGGSYQNVSGIYTDTLSTTHGCDSIVTLNLTANTPPVLTITSDSICIGETVTLTPGGADNYVWQPTVGTVGPTGILQLTPIANQTLTLTGTNAAGCSSDTIITVGVFPLPTVDLQLSATSICLGDELVLTGITNGQLQSFTGPDGFSSALLIDSDAPVNSGNYVFWVQSSEGCVNADSMGIVVNPMPIVTVSAMDSSLCIGESTVLTAAGANQYSWDPGTVNGATGMVSPGLTTLYTVIGTTTAGCADTAEVLVEVHPYPIVALDIDPINLTMENSVASLTNTSSGAITYVWDFGDVQMETMATNFDYTFPATDGLYPVTLIGTNVYGCTDSAVATVKVTSDYLLYVPNAFTPDADEFNPVFIPVLTAGFDPTTYEFDIYNRWGETVFSTKAVGEGWDGTFKGQRVQDGIYTYRIRFKRASNDGIILVHGHVNVLK